MTGHHHWPPHRLAHHPIPTYLLPSLCRAEAERAAIEGGAEEGGASREQRGRRSGGWEEPGGFVDGDEERGGGGGGGGGRRRGGGRRGRRRRRAGVPPWRRRRRAGWRAHSRWRAAAGCWGRTARRPRVRPEGGGAAQLRGRRRRRRGQGRVRCDAPRTRSTQRTTPRISHTPLLPGARPLASHTPRSFLAHDPSLHTPRSSHPTPHTPRILPPQLRAQLFRRVRPQDDAEQAFRQLSWKFHGKGPSKKRREKRMQVIGPLTNPADGPPSAATARPSSASSPARLPFALSSGHGAPDGRVLEGPRYGLHGCTTARPAVVEVYARRPLRHQRDPPADVAAAAAGGGGGSAKKKAKGGFAGGFNTG